jgi:hypothetical protein
MEYMISSLRGNLLTPILYVSTIASTEAFAAEEENANDDDKKRSAEEQGSDDIAHPPPPESKRLRTEESAAPEDDAAKKDDDAKDGESQQQQQPPLPMNYMPVPYGYFVAPGPFYPPMMYPFPPQQQQQQQGATTEGGDNATRKDGPQQFAHGQQQPPPMFFPTPMMMMPFRNDHHKRGVRLALHCDMEHLSDYQMLVRQQLELFEAGPEDVECNTQGRKKPVVTGQVGLRCRHCAAFPLRSRGRGAVYYPAKLHGVYQAAQNMAGSHLCKACQQIPSEIKEEMNNLRSRRDNASGGKQYWADGCRALGLIETEDGLRFLTSSSSSLPPPSAAPIAPAEV